MSSMPMTSPPMMALMTVGDDGSDDATIRRAHRSGAIIASCARCECRVPGNATTLFAVGYATVWIAIGLALFAMSRSDGMDPTLAIRCRRGRSVRRRSPALAMEGDTTPPLPHGVCGAARNVMTAWRDGWRLGVDCGLSCAAPMAVLFVAGLMDARMMVVITAAITAERVAPAGQVIARVTGAFALIAGFIIAIG